MRICFEPGQRDGLADQQYLDGLVAHLEQRQLEVVPFSSDMDAIGMIAEFTSSHPQVNGRALYTAKWLGKPVLALSVGDLQTDLRPELESANTVKLRELKTTNFVKVAIDIFLEVQCGYRVPLDKSEDRGQLPLAQDRLL